MAALPEVVRTLGPNANLTGGCLQKVTGLVGRELAKRVVGPVGSGPE